MSHQRTIDAASFIDMWTIGNVTSINESEHYKITTTPDPLGGIIKFITFENIEINGKIEIDSIDQKLPHLKLINCSISTFKIQNCNLGQMHISDSGIEWFELEKCKIESTSFWRSVFKYVQIVRDTDCKGVQFTGCSIDDISLRGNVKCEGLTLIDCGIRSLDFQNKANINLLWIEKTELLEIELLDKAVFENVHIVDSKCLLLAASQSVFSNSLKIRDSKINQLWYEVQETFNTEISDCYIQSLHFHPSLSVKFIISNTHVDNFSMAGVFKSGLLQITNCKTGLLTFHSFVNLASILISGLTPIGNSTRFKYFIYGHEIYLTGEPEHAFDEDVEDFFELESFKRDTTIAIIDSDIGRLMFSTNLSKFDKLYFANSKIIDAFIAIPKLPIIYTIENENLSEQKRIIYNQLKKLFENRGDNIAAMKYQRQELEIYFAQVNNNEEDKIPGERFQLLFNKYTNSHGTEWALTLKIVLLSSVMLYSLYCICLFGFDPHGKFLWNLLPYYFEFLNPTHKIDFLRKFDPSKNSSIDNIALIIDSIGRVTIPILIYQMIQAFRKYGKR